ncbi:MAG: hypothetical protein GY772_01865 [bacterium]|nr:hypothetical protein [bacterium]
MLRNHIAGVREVSVGAATCGTLRAAYPDARSYVEALAQAVSARPVRGRALVRRWEELPVRLFFQALDYNDGPEFFSMRACLFGHCLGWFNARGLNAEVWLSRKLPQLLKLKNELREQRGATPQAMRLLQELASTPATATTRARPHTRPHMAAIATDTATSTTTATSTATHRHHPTTAPPSGGGEGVVVVW